MRVHSTQTPFRIFLSIFSICLMLLIRCYFAVILLLLLYLFVVFFCQFIFWSFFVNLSASDSTFALLFVAKSQYIFFLCCFNHLQKKRINFILFSLFFILTCSQKWINRILMIVGHQIAKMRMFLEYKLICQV